MNEQEARKFIKNLILNRSPIKDKALEHFKKAFGHPFWSKETTVRFESTLDVDIVKEAEKIFNGKS
jgi:hypothetical protein